MQYRIRPFLFGVKEEGGNLDSAVFKPTHSIISRTSVLHLQSSTQVLDLTSQSSIIQTFT